MKLEISGLTFSYENKKIFDGLEFSIREGEFVSLLGPSGCGKSTLLQALGGLDAPTSGKVLLEGQDLYALPDAALARLRRTRLGFVFQAFHLLPEYTVRDNILLPLVLALFLTAKRWQWKVICAGIFCVGGMAMAMTYSRASWVGLAVSMAVFVFLWKPKLIPAFILLCVLAVPFLPTTVLNRILTITNTADSSTSSRVSLYKAAIEVIRRSPLTGAGLGTAATQTYIREFNLYHDKAPFVHSHNFYLEVWIQMGLLGVTGFVGSMLWNIKNAARAVRHSGPSVGRTVAAAAASAMCGAMVCGLADFLWNYPRVLVIFWFTFAMAIAGVKVCTEEAK